MFGHHESAQATVLFAEDVTGQWENQGYSKIEFVLEVRAPTGQTFRAKTTHHFITFTHYPQVGDVVNVKYNPKSLEASLDLKDDTRYGELHLKYQQQVDRQAGKAQRDALLAAAPGTPVSSPLLKGINPADLDPELMELVRMEEAERLAQSGGQQMPTFKQIMAARGTQMPAGFPGMAAPGNPQTAMGPAEAQRLRQELEYTGASGQAKILRKQQTGQPVQHHTPFLVEVLVQPDAQGFPFQCAFTAWIDTSKGTLTEGYTIPVKYDPQNTARMVFLLPN
ncbi:MAG TPA: hypothetical protein VFU32_07380 [Ktedonobacterales bacterium]|nr:hypothetical protein [Ktedonobacterales bacterium]